jgi:hypothetical protein
VRRVAGALARGGNTRPAVDRLTGELHRLADAAAREAERILANARRGLAGGARRGVREVARLEEELGRVARILAQTAARLTGQRTIPDRVISLCDLDARPIRRGKPYTPTEFGDKASVADTPEGFVASHQVYAGPRAVTSAQLQGCIIVAIRRRLTNARIEAINATLAAHVPPKAYGFHSGCPPRSWPHSAYAACCRRFPGPRNGSGGG